MNALRILISLFLPSLFLFSCSISLESPFVPSDQTDLQNQCLDDQRSALLQLQHDLRYAPNITFSSKVELWDLNSDCCSWKGVRCDALGYVIGLDLSHKNLSGSFHSIFNLYHLQSLNLAGNNFNTTLFQYEFGKLQNLTHLNLSDSCFHGQIPMEISYLTRLVSLDLSNQDYCYERNDQSVDLFNDHYPTLKLEKPNFKTLIKNMRSLRGLYLDRVNISTQSNKWCETTSLLLSKLSNLSMSYCGLTGPLCSSLSRLHYLSNLSLEGNPISYLPPNLLKNCSTFVSLNLKNCDLSGRFSSEVFLLPKMQSIDISGNYNLTGQLPEFPINNTLKVLSLAATNFSGKLPESIGNLKLITVLSLGSCSFSGSIPSSIANLTNLVELDLSYNSFTGSIPPFHRFGVPNLAYIYLWENHLSGSISSSLFTLPSLHSLRLGDNQLVGEIDEFPNTSSSLIENLDLRYNSFSFVKLEIFSQLNNLKLLDLSNISLLIENNNKSLTFPQLEILFLKLCNLTRFPEFLKSQDNLEWLHLSNNKISGVVPNWLWKKNLQVLDLSINSLSSLDQFLSNQSLTSSKDSLQRPICNSSQLWMFIASYNILNGSIPSCLGNISTLEYLDLQQNNFSGRIPEFARATQLHTLRLNENKLSGSIPSCLGNISTLEYLGLQENNFSGRIPEFARATQLYALRLNGNKLSGSIPSFLGNISTLEYLDLQQNNFSGRIPEFARATQLYILRLNENKLSGSIPSCLGNISTLEYLDLQQNNFSGRMPEFARATQLYTLQLNENKLEGKLPRSLANCTMLHVLNLGNNTLSDTFPLWLGKLPNLMVLILQENRFYGPIKHSKNNFPVLDVLDIASNNFSGQLSIQFFEATHELRSLKINGNKLEGRLPRSLANCKKLEVLDLGKNMIHDAFPFWLEKLSSLKVLVLRGNRFCGAIKVSGDENGFPMLHILDIASNNFSGELSVGFFQSLKGMRMMMTDGNKTKAEYVGDEYYQDSITIVNKGFEIFYEKILTIFACLDLSNNSFHGRIPEEIQNLKSLIMLNLSYNSFFGHIPITLGRLTELESLDLSQNELSGKIPPQLIGLTFLEVLNLSYNQLEGSIPQSYQFGTFSNDSYKGNPRLCGLPLTKKCNKVGLGMLTPREDVDTWIDHVSGWKIVLIGYGCGLVIGLYIGYTVLNELGNNWVDSLTQNRKRRRRRSR